MRGRFRISVAAMFAVMVMAMLGIATKAGAQPFAWNPPCTFTKIVNTTGCDAKVAIATNLTTVTVFVPANNSAPLTFGGGTIIKGVFTQAGTYVPAVSPGPIMPPPAAPVAATGWVSGVTLGPFGCCFDIYFDASPAPGCYIWLMPGTPPCIP